MENFVKTDGNHNEVDEDNTTRLTMEEILSKSSDDLDALVQVGFDTMASQQRLGVLQRLVTAVEKVQGFFQILLTADFDNKREAMLAADAISECRRYGASYEAILLRITAQCGVHSGRVDRVLRSMNSYNLNTNYKGKLPEWKQNQSKKGVRE